MSFLNYCDTNPDFLNDFLKYTAFVTFCSDTTVNEMYFDIRTFFRYIIFSKMQNVTDFNIDEFRKIDIKLITISDLQKISANKIDDFIYFLKYTLDNCAKTRNKKLASIKKLFTYLADKNLISYNPVKNVSRAKVEKRHPKYLNLDESKKLLSKTIQTECKNKIRNYTITCIFLNCCIRLSELVEININDIKLDEKTIKIHGKGNKDRIIYLDDAVMEVISTYLIVRPKLDKSYKDYKALFISNRNKRISKRTVQYIIKTELNNAFEDAKKYHTHSLRHSGATLMYDTNNTDILTIQEILGHKSLKSTELYTHVIDKKLKELMMNFNILDIGGINNGK